MSSAPVEQRRNAYGGGSRAPTHLHVETSLEGHKRDLEHEDHSLDMPTHAVHHHRSHSSESEALNSANIDDVPKLSELASKALQDEQYLEAERMFRRILHLTENESGADDLKVIRCRNNLATVLKKVNDFRGAEVLYRQTIKSCEKHFGPNHSRTLDCVNR
jgi:hypothetical protein